MTDKRIQLLREWEPLSNDTLKEARSKKGTAEPLLLRGILQKADALNQNGRIYPREILEREIENYQKFIAENRALGELDHPESSVVELKNASHVIREAKMDADGVVWGVVEALDTPAGRILKSLVESGIMIGISSRGVGSTVNEGGHTIVQDDFQLICWDIVGEPSTSNAFLFKEGLQRNISMQRDVSQEELNELKTSRFTRDVRIDRILNDIRRWK